MHKAYEFGDSHYLRSGKRYKVDCGYFFQHHHSSSSSRQKPNSPIASREESGLIPPTLQRILVNPTASSQTPPRGQGTPLAQKPQPPCRNMMVEDMKLLFIKGIGLKDPEKHWISCEVVQHVKQVIDDDIKMAQLTTTFRDKALNQFMKYSNGQNRTLVQVRVALISEFKKPKLESRCIIELKEIKHKSIESVWEFDQKFKTLLDQVSFDIAPQQHQEWFIATLLPHIRLPQMEQKVASQAEALEIVMKLEASPIAETSVGMAQIQNQLANLTLQLQDIKKGKEVGEEV